MPKYALLLASLALVSHERRAQPSIESEAQVQLSAAFIPGAHGPSGSLRSAALRDAASNEPGLGRSIISSNSVGQSGPLRSSVGLALPPRHVVLSSRSAADVSSRSYLSEDVKEEDSEAKSPQREDSNGSELGTLGRIGLVFMAQLPEAVSEDGGSPMRSFLAGAARTSASLGSIIAVDVALRRLFVAQSISFPSSLAGMMILFSILCAAQAVRPKSAGWLASAAAPGVGFISRWLALFFVPNLVVLPIVMQMSLSEAVRLFSLIFFGMCASLPLAALTGASALGKSASTETEASPSILPASSGSSAPPASVPKKPWVQLLACPAGTGIAAVLSQRILGGGMVTSALAYVHLVTCTVCGFLGGQQLVPKKAQKVLHPLITCTVVTQICIATFSTLAALPLYDVLRGYLVPGGSAWSAPGNLFLFMLGPATLSFAFQIFSRRKLMVQSAAAVASVVAVSASFGLFSTALASRMLGLCVPLRLAALPRQVTAPLAIAIAGMLRADPSLAATIVVITGLLAANFGQAILDAIGVQAPVARGLAMGAAGHGVGTAAMSEEKEAFPFAAIAMALNATLSTVLVSIPAVRRLLLWVAGA